MKKISEIDLDVTDIEVFKQLAKTNRALAELKGYSQSIPNEHILINAMTINEAKDSSEIEQIVTTHDEIYEELSTEVINSTAAKEVLNYRHALWHGFNFIKTYQFIHTNLLVEIQKKIEPEKYGIRKLPGTEVRNAITGEIIYTPPQSEEEIIELLTDMENFINSDVEIDPLIQMAIIHYQFEAIHPFYDGNGRTGRILNVLFLVLKNLLNSPVLYLSKYILRTKPEYYQLLNEMQSGSRESTEKWIIYILKGIEETSVETLNIVKNIKKELEAFSEEIKNEIPKIHSKTLVEALFFEFYTKVSHIQRTLNISRGTATKYLQQLENKGFLSSEMKGKTRIYKNERLFSIIEKSNQ